MDALLVASAKACGLQPAARYRLLLADPIVDSALVEAFRAWLQSVLA